ncbi:MAG TPA: hypothetical protein VFH73_29325 [Polyangia bacterium]|jgi:hypothetical protein|nr:hypothetical protein [Polyangia bacterium]
MARAKDVLVVGLGLLLGAVAGCGPGSLSPEFTDGGDASNVDMAAPVLGCDRAQTILAACLACHSTATAATNGGFDMEVTDWDKKLVGMSTPVTAPSTSLCKGKNLVFLEARTLPARGLFLDKIRLAMPPCGVQMPRLLPKLGTQDTACIEAWANGIVAASSKP